ncbi:hypothetical protein D210916BOD24_15440 [Alteromonas sp. D210916BOD_24]|uniref:cbb3-type cytochrome oxidase assembly protein CcoS n=1 Tax=Alteromonas sp. D210916BOD_24 TaxID=3157618 RepID=UPI00399CF770
MSIIYVLIPIAIIIVAVAIVIFFWAVKSNQFEDLDRQGYSILFDDDLPPEEKKLAEQRKKLQESQHSPSPVASRSTDKGDNGGH